MPLFASPLKVVHDPTGTARILVDWDYALADWPEFTGGHLVADVDRVKAASRKAFARGNEFNQFEMGWKREYPDPIQASRAQFRFIADPAIIPRNRAPIRFYLEDGSSFVMLEGIVKAWNAKAEGNIVFFALTISGGAMTIVP